MPITIIMPDGEKFTQRKDKTMNEAKPPELATTPVPTVDYVLQKAHGAGGPIRTIATVAAELEAALLASTRVKALRDELEALLGRKKRTRKAKP